MCTWHILVMVFASVVYIVQMASVVGLHGIKNSSRSL